MEKKKFILHISNFYMFLGICFVLLSIGIFLIPTLPYIVYRINPAETEKEIESLSENISSARLYICTKKGDLDGS